MRCTGFGSQSRSGAAGIGGGSEGCVYIELTTSGASWGRGPVASNIHGAHKRSTDAPALRHVKMLSALVSEDGNRVHVPGFYDGADPLNDAEEAMFQSAAENLDMAIAAENIGVARFISDDPPHLPEERPLRDLLQHGRASWAGNMYPGGAGAIPAPTASPPSTTCATSPAWTAWTWSRRSGTTSMSRATRTSR